MKLPAALKQIREIRTLSAVHSSIPVSYTHLYWVIIASITIANLFALRQQNLKRFMSFSSISQAGYIMLVVISGSAQGMTSLVYYVLIYMFANLAVFTVITIVALRAGTFTLENYNGLYTTCLLYTSRCV